VELREYLDIFRRRWLSVLLVALSSLALASLATLAMSKEYTATTRLFVAVAGDSVTDMAQGSDFAEKQMSSYAVVATSPKVLDPVIAQLGLSMTPVELAQTIEANVPLDTLILEITATDTDPRRAAQVANAVGSELARVAVEELSPRRNPTALNAVQVTTVAPAEVPDKPSSPHVLQNLVLGAGVGVLLGLSLAVLRQVLDTKVRKEEDVRTLTTSPILGVIAYDHEVSDHPVILREEPLAALSEEIRRLRTNLQFIDVVSRPKSIVISSSIPGEGKSTIAINLAVSLADTGARVVLVDADLRRPSVAEYVGIEGNVGLTTVLIGRADVEDVVQRLGTSTLDMLPAGQLPPNPSELLGSPAMRGLLDRLTATYDMVLLDSPPLLPVTDAAVLSKVAGGVLVVVGADRIHRPQLHDTLVSLDTAGIHLFGIVLNKTNPRDQATYAYGSARVADDGSTAAGQMTPNWYRPTLDGAPLGARNSSVVAAKDNPAASSRQNGAVPANEDAATRKRDVTGLTQQNVTGSTKQEAAPDKQNATGRGQQNAAARAKHDKAAAALLNVTAKAKPDQNVAAQAKRDEAAAAQQNVTAFSKLDGVAPADRVEPVPVNGDGDTPADRGEPEPPVKGDEVAPTKQENAALEQDQAEPAPWPSAPWLAEPIASQSQPAPHG
jgi:tyrosine-protein kinase